ncbi:transport protein TonB [Planctomycetes bacterium Pla163]|uniref:Transport protein TonB n=1 Tax=Rohdeia mirabilis TaxID=2528008 RepID=A0A518CWR2_9BACT|nr:transport protein TonB [Planctomycetes bacterium Pla163]
MLRAKARAGSGLSTGTLVVSVLVHVALLGTLIGLTTHRDTARQSGVVATIELPARNSDAAGGLDRELERLEPLLEDELDDQFDDPSMPPIPDPAPDPQPELDPFAVEDDEPAFADPRPNDRFAPLPSGSLGGPPAPDPRDEPVVDSAADSALDPVDSLDDVPLRADEDERAEPQLLRADPPDYPRLARRRGWEGSVFVDLRVGADGSVLDATVATSSGHSVLDEAALAAVRAWRFVPGAADRTVRHKVTFELR